MARQYFLLATSIQGAAQAPPAGGPLMGGVGPVHLGSVCLVSGEGECVPCASTRMGSGGTARKPLPGLGTQAEVFHQAPTLGDSQFTFSVGSPNH
jgi:hypothetical protein